MPKQLTLFEAERLTLEKSIAITAEILNQYIPDRHVFVAFSGGKDSSATVAVVINLIESGRVKPPKSLTVLYADTRMEILPLQVSAIGSLNEVEKRGFRTKVVTAEVDKRFLVYILGRGVPPPSNTMRWCTSKIKVEPMLAEIKHTLAELPDAESILQLTGVRLGESAVRDQRIAVSCSRDGGECGQGWFQRTTAERVDTLAPIVHWRVCHVWDYLSFEAPMSGFPTAMLAEAYGGDEAQEINARTGCVGCPLASKDSALERLLKQPQWAYLKPLTRLREIFAEMRSFNNRLQKDGSETRKDGSLVKNPGRKGPLTLEARTKFLEEILDIQARINLAAGLLDRPKIDILNREEEARIRELIDLGTFPDGWSGDEPLGHLLLPETYPDGSVQHLLW